MIFPEEVALGLRGRFLMVDVADEVVVSWGGGKECGVRDCRGIS